MALDTTISGADSDAYDTLANGLVYYSESGYCGTFWTGSPLVKGAVLVDVTALILDGGSGTETILSGDPFRVAGAPKRFTFSDSGVAVAGESPTLTFSPAAPTGGFDDDAAVTALVLTDEMVRRGTMYLDERYRMRLEGQKTTSGQALSWPRVSVFDEDGNTLASNAIPTNVIRAAFELARVVTSEMVAAGGQRIRSAGAGSARVVFAQGFSIESTLSFVDDLMAQYVKQSNRLVRA